MDPPPVSSCGGGSMVREALIAIAVAVLTVGIYKPLEILGMALVGGP
jgi:hypothetical protein